MIDDALPPRRQRRRARARRARRHDRHPARPALDAAGLDPPAAGDLRRQGADERAERAGRRRRRVRRRRPAARHPAGPAHVHHVVLPLARPAEPDRRRTASTSSSTTATTRPACGCSATSSTSSAESAEQTSELAKPSRIGVIATAGDRRDEDMRELGAVAAEHFDVVVVREDAGAARPRAAARPPSWSAEGARARMAEGARCKQVEIVLDEIDAVRHAMARANPGDLVVLCVDKHAPCSPSSRRCRTRPRPAPTSARPWPTPTGRPGPRPPDRRSGRQIRRSDRLTSRDHSRRSAPTRCACRARTSRTILRAAEPSGSPVRGGVMRGWPT